MLNQNNDENIFKKGCRADVLQMNRSVSWSIELTMNFYTLAINIFSVKVMFYWLWRQETHRKSIVRDQVKNVGK